MIFRMWRKNCEAVRQKRRTVFYMLFLLCIHSHMRYMNLVCRCCWMCAGTKLQTQAIDYAAANVYRWFCIYASTIDTSISGCCVASIREKYSRVSFLIEVLLFEEKVHILWSCQDKASPCLLLLSSFLLLVLCVLVLDVQGPCMRRTDGDKRLCVVSFSAQPQQPALVSRELVPLKTLTQLVPCTAIGLGAVDLETLPCLSHGIDVGDVAAPTSRETDSSCHPQQPPR